MASRNPNQQIQDDPATEGTTLLTSGKSNLPISSKAIIAVVSTLTGLAGVAATWFAIEELNPTETPEAAVATASVVVGAFLGVASGIGTFFGIQRCRGDESLRSSSNEITQRL